MFVTIPTIYFKYIAPPLTLFLAIFLIATEVGAQIPGTALRQPDSSSCATPEISNDQRRQLDEMARFAFQLKKSSGKAFTDVTYVPIRPHIFRNALGRGGIDLGKLNSVIALTNSYYLLNGAGIQFYLAGTTPDYIDNDALFNVFPTANEAVIDGRDAVNALNMYFVNAFSNSGQGGYAYFPDNQLQTTRLFILANSSSAEADLGNRLIPHELGHTFNLFHTFQGNTSSSPELVTRGSSANCATTGDLVCDTPADPYGLSGASTTYVNGCQQYNGTTVDSKGGVYAPSLTNIMSYYYPCTHDFTPGQYDRMQAGLALRQTHTAYSLTYPPTAVSAPTNLQARLGQSKYVVLDWQDNATNEMGYFVERATSATGPFLGVGGTAPNIAYYTDTKISPNTTYYYRIRPSNTTTGALSNVSSVVTSTTATCLPTYYSGCAQGDGLNTVVLNGETMSRNSGCSSNAYNEFLGASLTVTAGQTTYLSGKFLGTLYSTGISAWLDLNRDGTYSNSERLMGILTTGSFSGSFTIPASLSAGPIGMRLVTTREYYAYGSCDYPSFGETEDYTLFVANSTCSSPSALTVNNLTTNSAQLSWLPNGDAFSYDLRWKALGSDTWNSVSNLGTTSYTLTGLITGESYQWQVKSNCANGSSNYNGWSFATVCTAPSNLTTTNVTGSSALLNWSDLGVSRTYEIAWRPDNNSNWTVVSGLSTPAYSLTGLREGTVYYWRVRSSCLADDNQPYGATVSFVTDGICRPAITYGCQYDNGLKSFVFNDVILSQNSGCLPGGYQSFSTVTAPVTPGRSYTFSGSFLSSSNYGLGVWLDLNRNSIFENAERVFVTSTYLNGPFSGSLTIPASASSGPLRMRVIAGYYYTPYEACMAFSYGEAEDYWLNVYSANVPQITQLVDPSCIGVPLPLSIGTTAPFGSNNTFSVQLSDASGAFGASPTVLGTLSTPTGGSLTVVVPNTVPVADTYRMRVVSSNPVLTDTPITPVRITATCACPTPTDLTSTSLTGNGALLAWTNSSQANAHSIRYRKQGSLNWSVISSITTAPYWLRSLLSGATYEWQVSSVCSNNQLSDWSSTATFQTAFCGQVTLASTSQTLVTGQPATLTATLTGQSPWYFEVAQNGSYSTYFSGVTASPFTFTLSVPGSRSITVSYASNNCGVLPTSGTALISAPCAIPLSLTEANQTATSIDLRWAYAQGSNYLIQWKENGATTWTQSTSYCCSSYYLSGLQLGKTYQWRIRTTCPDGNQSDWSAERTFTINCPVPLSLSERVYPDKAQLLWGYMSQSNGNSLTYNLQWRTAESTTWTTLANVCCSVYDLNGLTNGQAYEWRIQTICPDGSTSAYTSPRSFTASCPTPSIGFDYNRTSTSTTISWQTTNGVAYELQWRVSGSTSAFASVTGLTSSPYTLTGLTNSTQYEVRLRAVCSALESSGFSALYYFITACTAPSVYTPIVSTNQAKIQWSDLGSGTRYNLIWRVAGSATSSTITSLTGGVYSLTGLTNNTAYEVQLQAVCSDGNTSGLTSARFFTTSCAKPSYTNSYNWGISTSSLSWENMGQGTSYELQYRTIGSPTWTNSLTVTSSSYSLTGLSPATGYEWQVRTLCGPEGSSAFTTPTSFTTLSCTIPTSLILYNPTTPTNAYLDWSFVPSNQGYELQWRPVGTTTWPNSTTVYSSESILSNLEPSTVYEWRVRTLCGSQMTSDYSTISSFTTTACSTPTNSREDGFGTNFALLNWNAAPGSGYVVRWREATTSTWNTYTTCCTSSYNYSVVMGRTYEWQVATKCGSSVTAFTASRFFTMSCPAPFNIREYVSTTSALLEWEYQGTIGYTVQWRSVGANSWNAVTTNTTSVLLEGLITSQAYEWRVQTSCLDNTTTAFSSVRYFTPQCNTPTSIFTFSTGPTSTWVYWKAFADATYSIRYRNQGTTTWTTITELTGSPYSLTGLSNNVTYEFQLQSVCSPNTSSGFTNSYYTTTSCRSDYGYSTSVSSNTAVIYINAPGGMPVDLIYRPVGSPTSTTITLTATTSPTIPYSLTGLTPGTAYEWKTATLCPGQTSPLLSPVRSFTTTTACSSMFTLANGNWNDPAVWSCGRVPIDSDDVEIRHAVTIPASITGKARSIRYWTSGRVLTETNATLRLGF